MIDPNPPSLTVSDPNASWTIGMSNSVGDLEITFAKSFVLYKYESCDVIYDFLGPSRHVLLFKTGRCLEFAERFGIVWIPKMGPEWVAIDRTAFYEWAHSEQTHGLDHKHELSAEQVQKMLMDPKND